MQLSTNEVNNYNYQLTERDVTRRPASARQAVHCRTCDKFVKVVAQDLGTQKGIDAGGDPFTIFVNEIIGECGHVVEELSH